jgi:hypothetical protein
LRFFSSSSSSSSFFFFFFFVKSNSKVSQSLVSAERFVFGWDKNVDYRCEDGRFLVCASRA